MTATDVMTAVLMPLGALFTLFGTLGLLRFPTLLGRMHAATKPDTVGLVLILAGAAFQLPDVAAAAPLVLVALFQFITIPVLAQTMGRVAYSRGETEEEHLVVDELADAVHASGTGNGADAPEEPGPRRR
ncbi:sodium:proton antiporter [Nocardiopsis gilva YIM 90087]|uniref:Sodium:proton antiporter n=1 Tax=Nocardiopsis gilva YIM 90087 TaxID=1235441 RepID=A0A223S4Y9_9ACTN|nr:monovalent cation/H(+) antiporter subunit G [Nocardiopsis gilva]ASU83137.1 sodium:proton antiporter [Nocardiopsis gilva YIM 90087]